MSTGELQSRRQAGLFGFFLTVLLLMVVLFLLRERPWREEDLAQPAVSDPEQTVEVLVAEVQGADGSRLRARLTPLHAEPARQEFEREALQRRLGLGAGEPWRLSLEWRRSESSSVPRAAGSGAGRFTGSGPARGEPLQAQLAALGLGGVAVEDAEGAALGALPERDPEPGAAGASPDPVRTLFAPPTSSLGPGQTIDWILWGRRPGPGARLVGLLPPLDAGDAEAAAEFAAATGLGGELRFEPQQVPRRELLRPLARLDRGSVGSDGKNAPRGSSEQP